MTFLELMEIVLPIALIAAVAYGLIRVALENKHNGD
jgi:hypothetical protein